jgi:hypothetical protein
MKIRTKHQGTDRLIWGGAATAVAGLAAYAARRGLETGWSAFSGHEPPKNPGSWRVSWGEAIAWTAVTGLTIGFARLFAERAARAGIARLTGKWPPG